MKKVGAFFLAILAVGAVIGCGNGAPAVEQPSAKDVSDMVALRQIFDSVQGDQTKLTPDQKKKFLDYGHGNQAEVDHLWAFMKNPRGGGVTEGDNKRGFTTGAGGKILPPGSDPNSAGPGSNR